MQRSHAHPSCVSRSARWASSSQSLSPTSNEYTLAHSVAGALHCHGGRCRDGPTDSLLPGVRCQTRQLGAQGFWFLFFSFLLPSRRAHAACKRRRTPRVCCGDRAHVHAHDEQRPQPRSPTLPPMVRWLGEKASPVGKHLIAREWTRHTVSDSLLIQPLKSPRAHIDGQDDRPQGSSGGASDGTGRTLKRNVIRDFDDRTSDWVFSGIISCALFVKCAV